MDVFQLLDSSTVSQIAYALASRYNAQRLQELGLQLTVNIPSNKVQFVGDPLTPIYPEILIWKPEFLGASKGKMVVAEVVETSASLNGNPINKWRFLYSLVSTGVIFDLVIPSGEATRVRTMLTLNNIVPTNLIGYTLSNGTYNFSIV